MVRLTIREDESGQTVTFPPELRLPTTEVFVTRQGNRLVIDPVAVTERASFLQWLATMEPWDGPGPDDDDPPPAEIDL